MEKVKHHSYHPPPTLYDFSLLILFLKKDALRKLAFVSCFRHIRKVYYLKYLNRRNGPRLNCICSNGRSFRLGKKEKKGFPRQMYFSSILYIILLIIDIKHAWVQTHVRARKCSNAKYQHTHCPSKNNLILY